MAGLAEPLGGQMDFTVAGALKKYRRMRGYRRFLIVAAVPFALGMAWFYDFNRTDILISVAIAAVFVSMGETEIRLKTMQNRLAQMADDLDALRGRENQ